MPDTHTIGKGESVPFLAAGWGFMWQTIWNDGNNSDLKTKRVDPDILLAGDSLYVPDMTAKDVSKPVEQTHNFVKKIPKAKFVLVLRRVPAAKKGIEAGTTEFWNYKDADPAPPDDEAAANVPYHFYADGVLIDQGNTDGNGQLSVTFSPVAAAGRVIFNRGTPQEISMDLGFREMDPLSEVTGVCKRLYNLGFPCPTDSTEVTVDVQMAIQAFQKKYQLTVNGTIDDPTRNKLKEIYGG